LSRRRRNHHRPGSITTVRSLAEPALIRAPGRASVDRPSSRAVLWAGGNRWRSRGAQRPKQTDVRIDIAKEQHRFEFCHTLCRTAGAYVVPQPKDVGFCEWLGRANLKCGGDDPFGPDAPFALLTFHAKHLNAGTVMVRTVSSSRRSALQGSRLSWMRRLLGLLEISGSLREPDGEAFGLSELSVHLQTFCRATRPNQSPPEAARATRPSRRRPICPYPSDIAGLKQLADPLRAQLDETRDDRAPPQSRTKESASAFVCSG
jgi:hypothetical protein